MISALIPLFPQGGDKTVDAAPFDAEVGALEVAGQILARLLFVLDALLIFGIELDGDAIHTVQHAQPCMLGDDQPAVENAKVPILQTVAKQQER